MVKRPRAIEPLCSTYLKDGNGLCAVCSTQDYENILRPFNYHEKVPPSFDLKDLWTTSQSCLFCKLVFDILLSSRDTGAVKICQNREPGWNCKVIPTGFMFGTSPGKEPFRTAFRRINFHLYRSNDPSPQKPEDCPGVQLMGREGDSKLLPYGRLVNPDRVDLSLPGHWLHLCSEQHPACANSVAEGHWDSTFRLIDFRRMCVVEAPSRSQYLALSYTWGDPAKVSHLKLTRETKKWLMQDEGLCGDNYSMIPTTIKDAITFGQSTHLNYLWVDALCIQQDDKEDVEAQIVRMDEIFAGATVTIVAGAGSDSWYGLPGVGASPKGRVGKQVQAWVQGIQLGSILQEYNCWRHSSPWNTRGWTCQESILSGRLLIFTDAQVFWVCKVALWYEDATLEHSMPHTANGKQQSLDPYRFYSYERLVHQFAGRAFGYQGDVMKAFRGLENSIRGIISDEFFWGLPISWFDAALLWDKNQHSPSQRRVEYPSWSWAGWNINGRRGDYITYSWPEGVYPELSFFKFHHDTSKLIHLSASKLVPEFHEGEDKAQKLVSEWKHWDSSSPPSIPAIPAIQPAAFSLSLPSTHFLIFHTSYAVLRVDYIPLAPLPTYWDSLNNLAFKGLALARQYVLSTFYFRRYQSNILHPYPQLPSLWKPAYSPCWWSPLYFIRSFTGKPIGTIRLDNAWRATNPEYLDFIVIARACAKKWDPHHGLYIMLVERKILEGVEITYRVQLLERPLKEEDWIATDPVATTILLG